MVNEKKKESLIQTVSIDTDENLMQSTFENIMTVAKELTDDVLGTMLSQVESIIIFDDKQAEKLIKIRNLIDTRVNDYY